MMMYETLAFVDDSGEKSLLAAALAEHESTRRGLDVSLVTGGLEPADRVRPELVTALDEVDLELDDRTPRQIQGADLHGTDYVVTMGCSICDFRPPFWHGPADRWGLEHVHVADVACARNQRDDLSERVNNLLDDLEAVG